MQCIQGDSMRAVCNDTYTSRVQDATALWDKALQRQLIWAYLMAPIYAPEDRQQLFDTTAEMIIGHDIMKVSLLMKMYENDGTSKLCLMSVQSVSVAPGIVGLVHKSESE